MSRFEWISAAAPVSVTDADELAHVGIGLALVLGDPDATAMVVEGHREDLLAFLDRARQAVDTYPARRVVVVDEDGNRSLRHVATGEWWTEESAAEQVRFASEDSAELRIEIREE